MSLANIMTKHCVNFLWLQRMLSLGVIDQIAKHCLTVMCVNISWYFSKNKDLLVEYHLQDWEEAVIFWVSVVQFKEHDGLPLAPAAILK